MQFDSIKYTQPELYSIEYSRTATLEKKKEGPRRSVTAFIQGSTKLKHKIVALVDLVQSLRFRAAITFFFGINAFWVPASKSCAPYGALETILCFPDLSSPRKTDRDGNPRGVSFLGLRDWVKRSSCEFHPILSPRTRGLGSAGA